MRQMIAAGGRERDPGGIHAVTARQEPTTHSRRDGQRQERSATGVSSEVLQEKASQRKGR